MSERGTGPIVVPDGYKWIALTISTLGMLMATIDGSITLISLPDIFRGIDIDPLIDEAVAQVSREHRSGQAVTPAVPALLDELSEGRSVEVNRRLIEDNAGLAGEAAVAYNQLQRA